MNSSTNIIGWLLVAVGAWLLFDIALYMRELVWYYQHRGMMPDTDSRNTE
jgi:hypothetical protein